MRPTRSAPSWKRPRPFGLGLAVIQRPTVSESNAIQGQGFDPRVHQIFQYEIGEFRLCG